VCVLCHPIAIPIPLHPIPSHLALSHPLHSFALLCPLPLTCPPTPSILFTPNPFCCHLFSSTSPSTFVAAFPSLSLVPASTTWTRLHLAPPLSLAFPLHTLRFHPNRFPSLPSASHQGSALANQSGRRKTAPPKPTSVLEPLPCCISHNRRPYQPQSIIAAQYPTVSVNRNEYHPHCSYQILPYVICHKLRPLCTLRSSAPSALSAHLCHNSFSLPQLAEPLVRLILHFPWLKWQVY